MDEGRVEEGRIGILFELDKSLVFVFEAPCAPQLKKMYSLIFN